MSLFVKNDKIQFLKLSNLQLPETDAELISKSFEIENKLTQLIFNEIYFNGEHLHTFLDGFKFLNTCKIINITKLGITEEYAETLFKALGNITNLIELFLDNNLIGKGIKFLGTTLDSNNHLTKISINNCRIDDVSFSSLHEILKVNKSITSIDMQINKVSDKSVNSLRFILEENSTIKCLNLLQNPLRQSNCEKNLPSSEMYRILLEY